jgi:hypothetical protein
MDLIRSGRKMMRGLVEFLSTTEAETCFQADSLLLFVFGDPREYHARYVPSSMPHRNNTQKEDEDSLRKMCLEK